MSFVLSAAAAQDDAARIDARYRNENNVVNKAKLLAKLGPLVLDRARDELHADNQAQALATLQYYRDEVRMTSTRLAATGANVEKRPDGFKELQVALRVSLQRLDDLIFSLPYESRAPFEAVRSDLSATEMSLFAALFPSAAEKDDKNK